MKFIAALFATALLAGCQTPHQFATPDKTWKTHIGQLKYGDKTRTIIGDVVVQRRGTEDFQLEFQKAGGIPLLTLREDATTARIEGLLARGSWQGAPSTAPEHLRNWLLLRDVWVASSSGGSVSFGYADDNQRFLFQFNR